MTEQTTRCGIVRAGRPMEGPSDLQVKSSSPGALISLVPVRTARDLNAAVASAKTVFETRPRNPDGVAGANARESVPSGPVWSGDIETAKSVGPHVEIGSVLINTHSTIRPSAPLGGVQAFGLGVDVTDAPVTFTQGSADQSINSIATS